MRRLGPKYNLTQDIQETKKQKWLLRQKFKLINKLRKHNDYQASLRNNNMTSINTEDNRLCEKQGRSKSTMDAATPKLDSENKPKPSNKVDAGIGTEPDILTMLSQLKSDK